MKQSVITFLFLFFGSMVLNAQTNQNVKERFVYHSIEILETGTDKVLEPKAECPGVVVFATVNDTDYLLISIGDEPFYNLQIVNVVENTFENNVKIKMYQGGEHKEGLGTYTANVFFTYDISKNHTIPELIRIEVNNSPNIIQLSGIMKLTN